MPSKKAKAFEEKINATLRYKEYACTGWQNKARFLPKFAYLADDELETLLQLGQEIERYAASVAKSLFTFGELLTAEDNGRVETAGKGRKSRQRVACHPVWRSHRT
jgi:hypothetical protein